MNGSKFKLGTLIIFSESIEAFEITSSRSHDRKLSLVTCTKHINVELKLLYGRYFKIR